jgi:hypothetical protein
LSASREIGNAKRCTRTLAVLISQRGLDRATAKLAIVAVTVIVAAGAFSQLFTWFFKPFLAQESLTVLSATVFATHGIALSSWQSGHTTYFSYIPVSRFWPMQFVEGGWLLALSILLIAATVWLVRRRAA